MKNKFAVALFLLLFATAQIFCGEDMVVKIDNYEITVPLGWLAQRTGSLTVFLLYSPVEENDDFQENINLTTEKLFSKYTVKGYLEASRKVVETVYGGFELLKEGENYHIISGNINGTVVQQIQFVEIKNNTAYILTCTSNPANFDRYLETFKKIHKSFKY